MSKQLDPQLVVIQRMIESNNEAMRRVRREAELEEEMEHAFLAAKTHLRIKELREQRNAVNIQRTVV